MTHDYPPLSGGGLALGVRELACVLQDEYHVVVWSSRLRDHFADDRRQCLTALSKGGVSYGRVTAARGMRSLIQADVLLAHWTFSFRRLSTLSVVLGPLLGKPTVCVIHTAPDHCTYNRVRHLPGWARQALWYLAAQAMRRCAAVVALGKAHSAALVAAGFPITHIQPMIVSLRTTGHSDVAAEAKPDPDGSAIGIAGELSLLKGSDLIPGLLRALTPEFSFRIAGTGPLSDQLARRVDDLAQEQRACVKMMGWVKPSRMEDFYRAVDFLLVLSRTEAQPRVVLEAMLAGAIVVAAQGNGGVDLVSDGVTGVLITADDPACCRRTLVELRHDPVLMAAIRRQARAFALKQVRDGRHQWRHFLADLLDRGAEPPGGTGGSVLQVRAKASASGAPGLPTTVWRGRRCG